MLRIFDVSLARAFYVELPRLLRRLVGRRSHGRPLYLPVSRGPLVLRLSSHHGDGPSGGVVLAEIIGIKDLLKELHAEDDRSHDPGTGA